MNKQLFLFLAVMCLAVNAGQSQIITPTESRNSILEGMRVTLQNVDVPAGAYEDVQSPFIIKKVVPEEVPVVRTFEDVPVETGIGEVLADNVALQVISRQFRPFGSLVMGERGILQLANGRTIAEGESFRAEIKGVEYEVTIADVTSKGYRLTLGEANVEKTFLTTTGSN